MDMKIISNEEYEAMPYMKPVEGFEGYFVTKDGKVLSSKQGSLKERRPHTNQKGYKHLPLYDGTKIQGKLVHRLVAQAFLSDYDESLQVNHINENEKGNNDVRNLCMCTSYENAMYGTRNERISEKHMIPIRCVETGQVFGSYKECAESLGLSRSHLSDYMSGKYNSVKGYHFEHVIED